MNRSPGTRTTYAVPSALWALLILGRLLSPPSAASADLDSLREHLAALEETTFVTAAVFKNGLKVLINEHRANPVVSIQVYGQTGIADEPDAFPGLSGLLASVLFRRSTDVGTGTTVQNARLLGAFLSSSAEYGHCRFEIQAPAGQWKRALQIHAEALSDSTYGPEEVAAGVALAREEARRRLRDPAETARGALLDLHSPLAGLKRWRAVLGGNLEAVTGRELSDWHRRIFAPGNMVLAVSGDVPAIEVLDEAARLYGAFRGSAVPAPAGSPMAAQGRFRYRLLQGNTRIGRILFGFPLPGAASRDYPALEVLSAALGLGNGSVLAGRLRDRDKLIYEGTTEWKPERGPGFLTIQVTAAPGAIDRAEIAVLAELELLKRAPMDEADLERARAQLERVYRDGLQTVSGRAGMLALFEIRGDWKRIDRHLDDIRKVRAEDVRRVAERYFRLDSCSLVEYLPEETDARNRTAPSVQATLEALLRPATDQELARRQGEIAPAFDIPERRDDYRFSWIRYPFRVASVLRGPELYIREDHTSPLIHMGLFYPGGPLKETEGDSGITALAASALLGGTSKKDAFTFHRQLEIYGGRLQPVVEADYFGFFFSIPSQNFPSGFGLLLEALNEPGLDPETVRWRKTLQGIERTRDAGCRGRIEAALHPVLFRGSPYSRCLLGTEETLSGISPEKLREWHGTHIKNRTPLVVIVGDSEGTSLASYFVKHYSGSRFRESALPQAHAQALEAQEAIEGEWADDRSIVLLGFQAPLYGDSDRPVTEVLRRYLEKNQAGMLQDGAQVQKIIVSYAPRLRSGSFIAYAVVHPGSEDKAQEAMERELRDSATGPYASREYRSAVNAAVGDFQLRQQEPFLQITDVAMHVLAGNGIEGYRSFQSRLKAVREEEIRDAAEGIITLERAVSLRIYGKEPAHISPVSQKPAAVEN